MAVVRIGGRKSGGLHTATCQHKRRVEYRGVLSVSLEARVLEQILSSTKGVREEEGQGGKGGRTARSKCLACSRRKPIITVTHLPSLVWATPNTSGIRGDCRIRPSGWVTRWLRHSRKP